MEFIYLGATVQNHILSEDIYFIHGLYALLGQEFIDEFYVIVDLDHFNVLGEEISFPKNKEIIGFASCDIAYYRAERLGLKSVLDKRSRLQDVLDYFLFKRRLGTYRVKNSLTIREREILNLLSDGIDSRGIAGKLGLNCKTIYTFRRNLMLKLGCGNRILLQNMLLN